MSISLCVLGEKNLNLYEINIRHGGLYDTNFLIKLETFCSCTTKYCQSIT